MEVSLRNKIGRGSYGVVYRVWNVSTGEEYALKKPADRSFKVAAWEREILIMKRIKHVRFPYQSPCTAPVSTANLVLGSYRRLAGLLRGARAVDTARVYA